MSPFPRVKNSCHLGTVNFSLSLPFEMMAYHQNFQALPRYAKKKKQQWHQLYFLFSDYNYMTGFVMSLALVLYLTMIIKNNFRKFWYD
jgi:lysylphosphatidylglycerol synthetase-like protein (DUF2156 family)